MWQAGLQWCQVVLKRGSTKKHFNFTSSIKFYPGNSCCSCLPNGIVVAWESERNQYIMLSIEDSSLFFKMLKPWPKHSIKEEKLDAPKLMHQVEAKDDELLQEKHVLHRDLKAIHFKQKVFRCGNGSRSTKQATVGGRRNLCCTTYVINYIRKL